MKTHCRNFSLALFFLFAVFILAACGGDGTDGLVGGDGLAGADGLDGVDYPGPVPAEYTSADGIEGGATYSKWYVTEGGGTGTLGDYSVTAGSDFVRCKACHGWDGMGNQGFYAGRTGISTGKSTRPDVSAIDLRERVMVGSLSQLFDRVKGVGGRAVNTEDNGHPDYSSLLTDSQIWNLVKFMREEWLNPGELYDLTIVGSPVHYDYSYSPALVVSPQLEFVNVGAGGDPVNGATLYTATCAGCHGADGTAIIFGGERTLGQFIREKPNEAWLKIKFGEAGKAAPMNGSMLADTEDLRDLYAALDDNGGSGGAFPSNWKVGGEVSGMAAADVLVLQIDGAELETITGAGRVDIDGVAVVDSFTFNTWVPDGTTYTVTVSDDSGAGGTCVIATGATDTADRHKKTKVIVNC